MSRSTPSFGADFQYQFVIVEPPASSAPLDVASESAAASESVSDGQSTAAPAQPRGPGRPRGSKNATKPDTVLPHVPAKRAAGRPPGSGHRQIARRNALRDQEERGTAITGLVSRQIIHGIFSDSTVACPGPTGTSVHTRADWRARRDPHTILFHDNPIFHSSHPICSTDHRLGPHEYFYAICF